MGKKSDSKSSFNIFQVATITILTATFSLIMGLLIANNIDYNGKYSKEINMFLKEYIKLKEEYYEEIDDAVTLKNAMDAIVNSLDPYTTVVDDSLSNLLNTKLEGEYKGVGVEVYNDIYGNIIVSNVIENTPAYEKGLLINDIIVKFNDIDLSGTSTTDFVNYIKASGDNEFNLTLLRNDNEMVVTLKRDKINLSSVSTTIYNEGNKKIGYIDVEIFALNTAEQFSDAIKSLEDKNIDSLIVDLRDNTGGHLDAVEKILNQFLDKNHILYQMQSKTSTEKHYSTSKVGKEYPVVVLVNEASASASEIFASAMQEEYGAKIVGTKTFGKGTVQEVGNLAYDTEYKITTKKWLTPKGKWINGEGVIPDVEVFMDDSSSVDNQLRKAIELLTK